jgi:aryl-alcohol dehydrogenase-like predicted oxidoreductase
MKEILMRKFFIFKSFYISLFIVAVFQGSYSLAATHATKYPNDSELLKNNPEAQDMDFVNLKQSNIPFRHVRKLHQDVPFLGLGTVELGRNWGIDPKKSIHPSEEEAKEILETAIKYGWTVIDTASSYHTSEERIGRYLPQHQYNYLLITKAGEHNIKANDPRCEKSEPGSLYCNKPEAAYDFSRTAIRNDINESLKKLGVNKIDVALLHLDDKDGGDILKKEEALQTLRELKREGKIHYIGVSVNGEAAKYAIENADIDVVELEYNLLAQQNKENIDLAYSKGIDVVVRGGLATGFLTDYVAQHLDDPQLPFGDKIRAIVNLVDGDYDKLIALNLDFLYANPHISTVLIGADQPKFIEKDTQLLNQVIAHTHEYTQLLKRAEEVLSSFPPEKTYTGNEVQKYMPHY